MQNLIFSFHPCLNQTGYIDCIVTFKVGNLIRERIRTITNNNQGNYRDDMIGSLFWLDDEMACILTTIKPEEVLTWKDVVFGLALAPYLDIDLEEYIEQDFRRRANDANDVNDANEVNLMKSAKLTLMGHKICDNRSCIYTPDRDFNLLDIVEHIGYLWMECNPDDYYILDEC